jgi:hypothetical protein
LFQLHLGLTFRKFSSQSNAEYINEQSIGNGDGADKVLGRGKTPQKMTHSGRAIMTDPGWILYELVVLDGQITPLIVDDRQLA